MSRFLPPCERGMALVVGLILLVITTLLALAAVSAATTELALGGNEKSRQLAFEITAAALETALAATSFPQGGVITDAQLTDPEFPDSQAGVETRYLGSSSIVPGFSVDRFVARHYELRSRGAGPRQARAEHRAGLMHIQEKP